uniref:Uncharacterized protein n=1 Tax=Leersia perrieri TaxID=77586 RepID=A0A0D9XPW0_9ORYZ
MMNAEEEIIARFERTTRDAANVQRETLRRILNENAGVEYLNGLGLAGLTDANDVETSFRARVPVVTHADVEPYIQRIADGDASAVLTAKPVTAISLSSGTTQGKRKYLLFNDEFLQSAIQFFLASIAFTNRRRVPDARARVARSVPRHPSRRRVAVARHDDGGEGFHGRHPRRAEALERRCAALSENNNWYGLTPALWPNARYVKATMTGSMEHYVSKLRHYAGGHLPLVAGNYASTEGVIGINVEQHMPPESVVFAVVPDAAYFEFIPLKPAGSGYTDADEAEPVGLTEVAVGEHYEIVMTTFTGLYRYRLGDVVKVPGFYHATPKVKFICRRNVILSINVDKNSELDLQLAVDSAAKILTADEVADYTSYVDTSSDPGHYVIFWELSGGADMLEKNANLSREEEEVISRFERTTRDAATVQRETLLRILDENAGVEYLRRLGLDGLTDVDSFHARVPVVTHADLEPYIQRIADGDTSPVLTAKPVTAITLSSGTTQGKRKYLLFNDERVKSSIQASQLTCAFTNREFPVEDGKALDFVYSGREVKTKGGLTATSDTTYKDTLLQRCCDELDRAFASAGYVQSRKTQSIGPLELRVVRSGTFQEVLRHYVAGGSSAGQFKLPRCVAPSNAGVLRVLTGNIIKVFFSTAYD